MQRDIYRCPYCLNHYDQGLRMPKSFKCCAFPLCLKCVQSMLQDNYGQVSFLCPNCNKSHPPTPEAFFTDPCFLTIIQGRSKSVVGICEEHHFKQSLFCITDQVPICKHCAQYEDHKGHEIQPIKVLKDNAAKRKEKLEGLLKDNLMKRQKMEEEIEMKLTRMQQLSRNQFFKMRKILRSREEEVTQNIQNMIMAEKEALINKYNDNKNRLEDQVAEISQNDFDFQANAPTDDYDLPMVETNYRLEAGYIEMQNILDQFLKKIHSLTFDQTQTNEVSTQTVDEELFEPFNGREWFRKASTEEKESESVGMGMEMKEEDFNPLEMETSKIFHDSDDENDLILRRKPILKSLRYDNETKEEFDETESLKDDPKEDEITKKKIQEIKKQMIERETTAQVKLDFSNLKILDETVTNVCSANFWKEIKNNKIYDIVVDFSGSSLTDDQLTKFNEGLLANMKKITTLTINLAQTQISDEGMRTLGYQILDYLYLKSFSLNCSKNSIKYSTLYSLILGLSWSWTTLEEIELIFDSTDINGEEALDSFSQMNKLRSIKLSFANSQITPKSLSSLVSCIGLIADNLETLDLNFNSTNIDDECLEAFINEVLSDSKKLRHFKFALGNTQISNKILIDFFQSLEPVAIRLETFELDLHKTSLRNSALECFCKDSLNEMLQLENLKLNLSETKITNDGLKHISLKKLKLKSLAINLSQTHITEGSLEILEKNCNFQDLSSLDLQIDSFFVNEETLKQFFSDIRDKCLNAKCLYFNQTQLSSTDQEQRSSDDNDSDSENEMSGSRKYRIVTTSVKKQVIAELKKAVILELNHKSNPEEISTFQFIQMTKDLGNEKFDGVLAKVLRNHPSSFRAIKKTPADWRRTIRRWIHSYYDSIKSDTYFTKSPNDGFSKISRYWFASLKANKKLNLLKMKIKQIIKNMSARNFSEFRQKILETLPELLFDKKCSKKHQNQKLNPNIFSKWFWKDYLRDNQDVKALWKKLPRQTLPKEEEV